MFGALGEAALIEFADVDGDLHAIVAAGGRCYHDRVARVEDVRHELGHVRLALRRLAYGGAHAALGSGAEAQLARAVGRLDRLFMAPIARLLGSRPVVIVPTGELHATPWAALPTLAGRPISVAPSARLWLGTTSASRALASHRAKTPMRSRPLRSRTASGRSARAGRARRTQPSAVRSSSPAPGWPGPNMKRPLLGRCTPPVKSCRALLQRWLLSWPSWRGRALPT